MSKKRVLTIFDHYPQITETYIENEIRQLAPRCEFKILASLFGGELRNEVRSRGFGFTATVPHLSLR